MPWDAWVLMLMTAAGAMLFLACIVEDLRNSGRYEKKPRGRHRRGRNAPKARREVNSSWISTNDWKAATSATRNHR